MGGLWHKGGMTHTVREKQKLLARVRRIRGQVEAIERALDGEAECERIMHMIAGIRGGIAGLMAEVVEDHVSHPSGRSREVPRRAECRRRRSTDRSGPHLSEMRRHDRK